MRIIRLKNKYDSKIYVLDEQKLIFKINCLCKDFIHRRLKSVGENADKKYYAEHTKLLKIINVW